MLHKVAWVWFPTFDSLKEGTFKIIWIQVECLICSKNILPDERTRCSGHHCEVTLHKVCSEKSDGSCPRHISCWNKATDLKKNCYHFSQDCKQWFAIDINAYLCIQWEIITYLVSLKSLFVSIIYDDSSPHIFVNCSDMFLLQKENNLAPAETCSAWMYTM